LHAIETVISGGIYYSAAQAQKTGAADDAEAITDRANARYFNH
jgi:hypothetical protein